MNYTFNVGGVWAMQTRTYVNEKVYILKKYGGGGHYIYSGCGVSLKEHGWYIG